MREASKPDDFVMAIIVFVAILIMIILIPCAGENLIQESHMIRSGEPGPALTLAPAMVNLKPLQHIIVGSAGLGANVPLGLHSALLETPKWEIGGWTEVERGSPTWGKSHEIPFFAPSLNTSRFNSR